MKENGLFSKVMQSVGLIATSLGSAGLPYLMLYQFDTYIRVVISLAYGFLFGGAYVYNEKFVGSSTGRFVLRVGGAFGTSAVFFSALKALDMRSSISAIALKSYEDISRSTGINAARGIVTKPREAAAAYLGDIDFGANPVDFLHWLSSETTISVTTVFVLTAVLFSLNVDMANTVLYYRNLKNSIASVVFNSSKVGMSRAGNFLSPMVAFVGDLFSSLFGICSEMVGIVYESIRAVRVFIARKSGNEVKKPPTQSGARNMGETGGRTPARGGGRTAPKKHNAPSGRKPGNGGHVHLKTRTGPSEELTGEDLRNKIVDIYVNWTKHPEVQVGGKFSQRALARHLGCAPTTCRDHINNYLVDRMVSLILENKNVTSEEVAKILKISPQKNVDVLFERAKGIVD